MIRCAHVLQKLHLRPERSIQISRAFGSAANVNDSIKENLYAVSHDGLVKQLQSWDVPAFRAQQVRQWVYQRGVISFDEMLNLPKELRSKLEEKYCIGTLRTKAELISQKDGTIKRAYELPDKQIIESVLMPYKSGRFTACISSQAGCAMGCTFCATGQMGFFRQLTATEIFEQVQAFSALLLARGGGERLSNVVFMGMGEPLANYKHVMEAVRRIIADLGIGARHITISTVGLVPRIRKLMEEDVQVGLAVSLHQTQDAARSALMPINTRYNIAELLQVCQEYTVKTKRRISFEWALIRGQTDSTETAHSLGRLLKGMLCHVNVIPLNPTTGFAGKPTPKEEVAKFCNILGEYGIACTPRMRRGIDIDAGCGQLRADLIQRKAVRSGGLAAELALITESEPLSHSDTTSAQFREREGLYLERSGHSNGRS